MFRREHLSDEGRVDQGYIFPLHEGTLRCHPTSAAGHNRRTNCHPSVPVPLYCLITASKRLARAGGALCTRPRLARGQVRAPPGTQTSLTSLTRNGVSAAKSEKLFTGATRAGGASHARASVVPIARKETASSQPKTPGYRSGLAR